jgi:hypothetical protein
LPDHFILGPIALFTLGGSIYNLIRAWGRDSGRIDAALIFALSVVAFLLFLFCRTFPLRAQDRVIRAEENMRHFVMTGKLLDPRLSIRQIIGLRFASDAEFPAVAQRAAAESMSADAIKRAVKNWRVDSYRV